MARPKGVIPAMVGLEKTGQARRITKKNLFGVQSDAGASVPSGCVRAPSGLVVESTPAVAGAGRVFGETEFDERIAEMARLVELRQPLFKARK